MEVFIIKPLQESGVRQVVFVIDDLDKCEGDKPVSDILAVLAKFQTEIRELKVKFLITSLPQKEPSDFGKLFQHLVNQGFIKAFDLRQVAPEEVNEEIRWFFEHQLSDFKSQFNLDDFDFGVGEWATQTDLDRLCERAEGQFAKAKEMLKTIYSNPHALAEEWFNVGAK